MTYIPEHDGTLEHNYARVAWIREVAEMMDRIVQRLGELEIQLEEARAWLKVLPEEIESKAKAMRDEALSNLTSIASSPTAARVAFEYASPALTAEWVLANSEQIIAGARKSSVDRIEKEISELKRSRGSWIASLFGDA